MRSKTPLFGLLPFVFTFHSDSISRQQRKSELFLSFPQILALPHMIQQLEYILELDHVGVLTLRLLIHLAIVDMDYMKHNMIISFSILGNGFNPFYSFVY